MSDKTPYQICREFVDLFGMIQKNRRIRTPRLGPSRKHSGSGLSTAASRERPAGSRPAGAAQTGWSSREEQRDHGPVYLPGHRDDTVINAVIKSVADRREFLSILTAAVSLFPAVVSPSPGTHRRLL